MFCPNCGHEKKDDEVKCPKCGAGPHQSGVGDPELCSIGESELVETSQDVIGEMKITPGGEDQ